jgi:glycine/D-amino acid oxidase-like deaminating enzyme
MESPRYDYIIIGAGIAGLSTAHHLTKDGHSVLVLEEGDGTTSASFASTAEMNHDPDAHWETVVKRFGIDGAKQLWQLCANGIDLLSEFAHQIGEDHFKTDRVPAYFYAYRDEDVAALQKKYDFYTSIGAHVSFDTENLPHPRFKAVLTIHGEGVTNNQQILKVLAHTTRAQGGVIMHHQKVTSVHEGIVTTRSGAVFHGKNIVIATGDGGGLLPKSFAIEHKRTFVLSYKKENLPELFRSCVLWDTDEPYHYLRSFDSSRLWIGGEDVYEKDYTPSKKNDEEKYALLADYAKKLFDTDDSYVRESAWSGSFYPAIRGLPYIGEIAGTNHVANTAFGGTGIITSFISGYLIAAWERGELLEHKKLFATDW